MIFNLYTNAPKGKLPKIEIKNSSDKEIYLPSPELQTAVNVALALRQPLLLTGEPGTGKTRLAWHLADYFDLGSPLVFNAQTSSIKKDLFYAYDALGHFQRAHNSQGEKIRPEEIEDSFIRYEALGEAIRRAEGENPQRSVVLIDEIDKAPRDLPNDLLAALEDLEFTIPEIPGNVKPYKCPPELWPIIIITSNSEKDLPDAFLRRVIYHHIEFKDNKLLEIIAAKRIAGLNESDLPTIINHFESVRNKGLIKKPATAELIAWATLLPKIGLPVDKLKKDAVLSDEEQQLLHNSYAVLAKNREDLQNIRK